MKLQIRLHISSSFKMTYRNAVKEKKLCEDMITSENIIFREFDECTERRTFAVSCTRRRFCARCTLATTRTPTRERQWKRLEAEHNTGAGRTRGALGGAR
jgi:hypothetical protein